MKNEEHENINKLLSIRSTASNVPSLEESLAVIKDILKQHTEITVESFLHNEKPSLLAYKKGKRPEKFKVLLNGHLDVVPARDEQFEPYMKNGRLYARGALDMKVAAYTLTEVFAELVNEVDYPLGLQIVTDEEIGGKDGTKYQIEHGVDTDFILAGEFTNLDINIASKGICWLKARAHGTSAHSAYLWEGENALHHLHDFINKLMQAYPILATEAWKTTVNLAEITTPHATTNRVPDVAEATFDIRYTPEDSHFANLETAKKFFQSLSDKVEVDIPFFESCHKVKEDNIYVQQLAQSIKNVMHEQPRLYKKNGASDVRYYSDKGRAAVTFGLCGEGLHSDNEYTEIASIDQYRSILRDFLTHL